MPDIFKKNRKKRIALLKQLIDKIEHGEYNSEEIDLELGNSARREYKSPAERSSYNYGYMTDGEAADLASPKGEI